MKRKMNRTQWKETRKYYSRRAILYYFTKHKLKMFKIYCFRQWFKISKYEHEHFYNYMFNCLICKKTKLDFDRERLKIKNDTN